MEDPAGVIGITTTSQQQPKTKSPILTIKRAGRNNNGQWQEFIDREQSSVDHLLKDSFASFCQEHMKENVNVDNSKFNKYNSLTLGSSYRMRRYSNNSSPETSPGKKMAPDFASSSKTMPRKPKFLFRDQEDTDGLHLPPGIEELESLYAPMKNLSRPLPSARDYSDQSPMPVPHPLMTNWNEIEAFKRRRDDDDLESEICSVVIPPSLPPIQSHAVLEKSLGHEIPSRSHTFMTSSPLAFPPPLPTRTSSKLSLQRPRHLNLTSDTIYANTMSLNRSSLMSTGSSEESSGSSQTQDEVTSPSVSEAVFAWPNYSVNNHGSSPSPSTEEHRSVSQIGGEVADSSASEASSGAYVKMQRQVSATGGSNSSSESSTYMNVIYSAVQRQGGGGSVENAITPYMEMTSPPPPPKSLARSSQNVKMLPNANVETISSIYARPQKSSTTPVTRSSSSASSSSKKSRKPPNLELKQLMREVAHKRTFRVGLNLFNSKPEAGIEFLAAKGMIDLSSECVGKFLYNTSGLSLEKVGDYLGSLQNPFAMKVLDSFMQEFDFGGLRIDKSLRLLLVRVRVSGEAQKIERIMEVFGKRYAKCNPSFASKLKSQDSIVTLAFAVMLLNTDLHTPNLKIDKRMQVQDFISNLSGVDGGRDFDHKLLKQIYKGIKKQEFVTGVDHVAQVQALQHSILNEQGKPLSGLSEPHRRLVCICRLVEVMDINARKEPPAGSHQRHLFLFNDLLVVTKKTGSSKVQSYAQRDSFPLTNLDVTLFHTPVYSHGIQIGRKSDGHVLVTLNADSEHDRYKFVMDLQESIFEMDQMQRAANELAR